jgi:hypothetical protein
LPGGDRMTRLKRVSTDLLEPDAAMPNYTYTVTDKSKNKKTWILKIQRVNPLDGVCAHYTEIHFTQPKPTELTGSLWKSAHVTFVLGGLSSHWYVRAGKNAWCLKLKDGDTALRADDSTIANNVLSDAIDNNWIVAKPPGAADEDGFAPVVRGRGAKHKTH